MTNTPEPDTPTTRLRRILVLYAVSSSPHRMRATIRHHLHTLDSNPIKHKLLYYNAFLGIPTRLLRHLDFDAVILHTTFLGARWSRHFAYWKPLVDGIRELNCLKIALPQDEYDHSEILEAWLQEWNIGVIFTLYEAQREILYPHLHHQVHFVPCFAGYIDEAAAQQIAPRLRPVSERRIDIVYRSSHLPYWYGSQGQLKHEIAQIVQDRALEHGLVCDISTHPKDVILGDRWLEFLASSKAVIGIESGSRVIDQRGKIKAQIQSILEHAPNLTFSEVSDRLPEGWDSYRFFSIGPRHFEAVITKTCQILIEGEYDGVLRPNEHYIPLRPDFSNLDEALEKIKDHKYVSEMVERAYEDIYLKGHYTYRHFAVSLEQAINAYSHSASDVEERNNPFLWRVGVVMAWLSRWAMVPCYLIIESIRKTPALIRMAQGVVNRFRQPESWASR